MLTTSAAIAFLRVGQFGNARAHRRGVKSVFVNFAKAAWRQDDTNGGRLLLQSRCMIVEEEE